MSRQHQQLSTNNSGRETFGLIQRLQEAAVSARSIAGQVWDNAKPMFDHGRTELAAALFSGHAHVMYMKGQEGVDTSRESDKGQANLTPEREQNSREM